MSATGRVLEQRLIHAAGNHLLAAAIDHFLQSPCEGEAPLGIEQALITSEKPPFAAWIAHPAALVGGLIARGHVDPTDGQQHYAATQHFRAAKTKQIAMR